MSYRTIESSQALKSELRKKFGVKFTCRRSGSRFFRIEYIDGPAYDEVQAFLNEMNDDSRDEIMTDLFVSSQYTILTRHISPSNLSKCSVLLAKAFGIAPIGEDKTSHEVREKSGGCWTLGQWASRVLGKADLRKPFDKLVCEDGRMQVA
jgi:hypothetical protein